MNIQERKNEMLLNIAQENGLDYVETTIGLNGYPKQIKGAIIGFNDFEQFNDLRRQYNLSSVYLTRRCGNHLWNRGNEEYILTPFDVDESIFGDGYEIWYKGDAERYLEYVLECVLSEFKDDLKQFNIDVNKMPLSELFDKIIDLYNSDDETYLEYDFNPIIKALRNCVEVLFAIEKLDSIEFGVLTCYNELYDAHLRLTTMSYTEDVYHNAIALQ
jgi:hypothetical protein